MSRLLLGEILQAVDDVSNNTAQSVPLISVNIVKCQIVSLFLPRLVRQLLLLLNRSGEHLRSLTDWGWCHGRWQFEPSNLGSLQPGIKWLHCCLRLKLISLVTWKHRGQRRYWGSVNSGARACLPVWGVNHSPRSCCAWQLTLHTQYLFPWSCYETNVAVVKTVDSFLNLTLYKKTQMQSCVPCHRK